MGHCLSDALAGHPSPKSPKKPSVAPFYFGDIVGVQTPQGFGGCALRRRLRQCSLNKERLLCFLLQQNRSSTLNRTHPVGYCLSDALAGHPSPKSPKKRDVGIFWGNFGEGCPRRSYQKKRGVAPFYFGDIAGVRTPQGVGGCALRRRLRKRSSKKECPL